MTKFILVGCGSIAPRHITEIMRTGSLVAVCDTDPLKLNEYKQRYDVSGYASFDEVMNAKVEADLVVICTPNGYHASQSITAMNHGYHVICEKPMSIHRDDAHAMLDASKKQNKSLTIVKQNRFNGPIVQLKEWIDSGDSGKVFSISMNCLWNRNAAYYTTSSWRGTLALDGGILFTQFSHYIDFLYWIFGEVEEITGTQSNVHHQALTQFADQGVATLRFKSGVIGTLHYSINAFDKNMESSLTVIAEKGNVRIGGLSCNTFEYQHISGKPLFQPTSEDHLNQYTSYTGSSSNHHFVYDQVLKGIQLGEYDLKSAFEAMKTVELIERICAL